MDRTGHELVIAVVAESRVPKVMEAARSAGARAVTALRGRDRDLIQPATFLGAPIEPGREILFIVIEAETMPAVMDAIRDAGELEKPDRGLAISVSLSRVEGLVTSLRRP